MIDKKEVNDLVRNKRGSSYAFSDSWLMGATESDMAHIMDIEENSYPKELQAPKEILEERLSTFGIRMIKDEHGILGFYTAIPVFLDFDGDYITKIKEFRHPHYQKWFEEYRNKSGFNALFVTSTAVHKDCQGRGYGKLLVNDSLILARDLGLEYRASVLRIPRYQELIEKISVEEYLERCKMPSYEKSQIIDKTINLYLSQDFKLLDIIEHYEEDKESADYGVFAIKKIISLKHPC